MSWLAVPKAPSLLHRENVRKVGQGWFVGGPAIPACYSQSTLAPTFLTHPALGNCNQGWPAGRRRCVLWGSHKESSPHHPSSWVELELRHFRVLRRLAFRWSSPNCWRTSESIPGAAPNPSCPRRWTTPKAHRRLRVCSMKHSRQVLQDTTCQIILVSLSGCRATLRQRSFDLKCAHC